MVSKRLVASYVFDWIVILVIAALAGIFSALEPHAHDFSLVDLNISFPLKDDTVPIWVAGVVAGVLPAIVIPIVSFIFVPGRSYAQGKSRNELFKLKLWEWHTGWLGLAMSLATALAITQGLKNFGKPRPNALARCQPDFEHVEKYYVGPAVAVEFNKEWSLVSKAICMQPDQHTLKDAFQSWPSGHSSTSFAGLFYLTLYLASKFGAALPYLPPFVTGRRSGSNGGGPRDVDASQAMYKRSESRDEPIVYRDEAAAAPVYTLLFILVPLGGAFYIALSRWMDYAHHGFDVISGSLIGIVTAYFAFRWYHLPVGRGAGWSWRARSPDRAFGVGIGRHGYVDEERPIRTPATDMEMGLINNSRSSQQDK